MIIIILIIYLENIARVRLLTVGISIKLLKNLYIYIYLSFLDILCNIEIYACLLFYLLIKGFWFIVVLSQ